MATPTVERQRDALVGRRLKALTGAFDSFSVYLGDRLGGYGALAEGGPHPQQRALRARMAGAAGGGRQPDR